MPIRHPQAGQCIFCAFSKPQPVWPSSRPYRAQAASLSSTPARSQRRVLRGGDGASVVRKYCMPPRNFKFELGESHVRPAFFQKNAPRQSEAKTPSNKFHEVVLGRLALMEPQLLQSPVMDMPGITKDDAAKAVESYRNFVWDAFSPVFVSGDESQKKTELMRDLRKAFVEKGQTGIDAHLKYGFYGHVLGAHFTETNLQNQKGMADLRYPTEWFPKARGISRTIHLHIGPTNSGKTYHALKRLEQSKNGVYAGPLRLLAHEVYSRLNTKGISCALITGEEQRLPPGWKDEESRAIACTVEMVPLDRELDVAVIDEIQMLGNLERGWAWTSALTGVLAKEVHVCGEERALPLVMQIAAATGDKVEVHRYKRLTPLKTEAQSLNGNFKYLRKGDCVVTFSVMAIHSLRQEIERRTGKKVAVVYGSLPPETRAQQARLFNDPDNDYDYLVASDAIGMGLNLSIKRVIFETVQKNNGQDLVTLTGPEIRQIAGRAGRYRTANQDSQAATASQDEKVDSDDKTALSTTPLEPPAGPQNIGYVTTLEKADLPIVARAMENPVDTLNSAGIAPPSDLIQRFSSYFPPGTPFSYILVRLDEISQLNSRYHLCRSRDLIAVADAIHSVKNLTIIDRIVLCNAPINPREKASLKLIEELATCIADQRGGGVLDIRALNIDVLDREVEGTRDYLKELEMLHKGLVLYLWLSFRFPGIFTTRPLAQHVKELVEVNIEATLKQMSFDASRRKRDREQMRRRALLEEFTRDMMVNGKEEAPTGISNGDDADAQLDEGAATVANGKVDGSAGEPIYEDAATEATPLGFEDEIDVAAEVADASTAKDLNGTPELSRHGDNTEESKESAHA